MQESSSVCEHEKDLTEILIAHRKIPGQPKLILGSHAKACQVSFADLVRKTCKFGLILRSHRASPAKTPERKFEGDMNTFSPIV